MNDSGFNFAVLKNNVLYHRNSWSILMEKFAYRNLVKHFISGMGNDASPMLIDFIWKPTCISI